MPRSLGSASFQIACGYEDQNDSDTLREDPLLKLVCGSLPESGRDLASQPTICRLENAATIRSCHQIAEVLFELYLRRRENDGAAPQRVLLDFDATADPTHGEQEGSYYHGYYQQSTSTIHFWSSMARVDTSSRRSLGRETLTRATPRWPS